MEHNVPQLSTQCLGGVLSGPALLVNSKQSATNHVCMHIIRIDTESNSLENLENQLQSSWDLESLGIIQQERTLYDTFCRAAAIENGHYKVMLPWREYHKTLPNNYQLSHQRLQGYSITYDRIQPCLDNMTKLSMIRASKQLWNLPQMLATYTCT